MRKTRRLADASTLACLDSSDSPSSPPSLPLYYWKSAYAANASDGLLALTAQRAGARPSPSSTVELWGLGGAIGRVPSDATAFAHRDSPFLVTFESNWRDHAATAANIAWARDSMRAAERYTGGTYLNFTAHEAGGDALVRDAYGPNYERLRQVKAQYDPSNLLRGNFNVTPSGG